MSEKTVFLVYVTCANREAAIRIGRSLVNARLAACANVLDGVRSIYRWQGEVSEDDETLCLIKTTEDRLDALRERVLELHTYDLPEVIAVPVAGGNPAYLDWVRESVAPEE